MDKTAFTTFIINPSAGFGKARKNLKNIEAQIKEQRPGAKIYLTRHALHATGLTKRALQEGAKRIVVVGGDGTLNEVINGFFDAEGKPHNKTAAVAIVPSGTGSDFWRSINGPKNLHESIDFALNHEAKPTDIGLVEAINDNGQKVKRFFLNVSSIGLSGLVAGFMKTVTKKLGSQGAYFLATLQAIRNFQPTAMSLSVDGKEVILDNCSLISFANGKYFGSGMKIAPKALLDDGMFDLITVQKLGALFFLLNGHRVYRGTHLDLENVQYYRQAECEIKSLGKEPVYIETDGEIFAQLPAKYSVIPKGIMVVR